MKLMINHSFLIFVSDNVGKNFLINFCQNQTNEVVITRRLNQKILCAQYSECICVNFVFFENFG